MIDEDGNSPHVVAYMLIGAGVNGVIALYQGKTGREVLGAMAAGAVEGAISSWTMGVNKTVLKIALDALGGAVSSLTEQLIGNSSVDGTTLLIDATSSAASSFISSRIELNGKESTNWNVMRDIR